MPNVTIPASIEDAKERLEGLGALLTARGWERAAIVFAFTAPQQGRRNIGGNPPKLTIREFCALGITGLRDHEAVAFHRRTVEQAIRDGLMVEPVPGARLVLPTVTYPPETNGQGAQPNAGGRGDPVAVERRAAADPDYARDVAERLARVAPDPVAEAVAEHRPAREATFRASARRLPEQPFTSPPVVGDSEAVGLIMEADAIVRRIDTQVYAATLHLEAHREAWGDGAFGTPLQRLREKAERLTTLVDLASGLTEGDLAALLADGGDA